MNKNDAKKIAETITNEQLQAMFNAAKEKVSDWTKVSVINKNLTKGAAWNILAKNFDVNTKYHHISKTNMVREFGEFLQIEINPKKVKKKYNPLHEDPVF